MNLGFFCSLRIVLKITFEARQYLHRDWILESHSNYNFINLFKMKEVIFSQDLWKIITLFFLKSRGF